ncbi:unnamed protein product [Soboliphyme baturini]|uniref:Uncharacterized protein n=1 Tax=Soboliphyme baturini TaxID=241478 RepID=A0A183IFT8_9BILA|nr:unnamed protein product [Soboliphyme baturini]
MQSEMAVDLTLDLGAQKRKRKATTMSPEPSEPVMATTSTNRIESKVGNRFRVQWMMALADTGGTIEATSYFIDNWLAPTGCRRVKMARANYCLPRVLAQDIAVVLPVRRQSVCPVVFDLEDAASGFSSALARSAKNTFVYTTQLLIFVARFGRYIIAGKR